MIYCLAISLFLSHAIFSMEENIEKKIDTFPLCNVHSDVLNTYLLSYLVDNIEFNEFEFNDEFVQRMENATWIKHDSNPVIKLTDTNKNQFSYVIPSKNNNFLGAFKEQIKKNQIKLLKNNKSNDEIYAYDFTRQDFCSMAVANSGKKLIICFINFDQKHYNFEYHDIANMKKLDLAPFPFKNKNLAEAATPFVFLNDQETTLGMAFPSCPEVIQYENMKFEARPNPKKPVKKKIFSLQLQDKSILPGLIEFASSKNKREKITTLLDLFIRAKIVKNTLQEDKK